LKKKIHRKISKTIEKIYGRKPAKLSVKLTSKGYFITVLFDNAEKLVNVKVASKLNRRLVKKLEKQGVKVAGVTINGIIKKV